LNESAPNNTPPDKGGLYKIHTQILTALLYPLHPSLKPFYTLIYINTIHNCPVFDAFPSSVSAVILAQKLVFLQVLPVSAIVLLLYCSSEAYNIAVF
jgi:hypothetical protein